MSVPAKILRMIQRKVSKALKNPSKHYTLYWDPDKAMECYIWFHLQTGPYRTTNHILYVNFKGPSGFYPFHPPSVKFMTVPFHTNVYQGGSICVNVFTDGKEWSAENGIDCIAENIILLLNDQNPNSPANGAAGKLFASCTKKWKEFIKQYKKDNGKPPSPFLQDKLFEEFQKQVEKHCKYSVVKYNKMFPKLTGALR